MILAVSVFAGCNKNVIEEPGLTGSLSLNLSYEGEYATKADLPEVNVDDFKVRLQRPADQWEKVFTYAELKQQIVENGAVPLLPGNYTITAYSPDTSPAEWEQPIFSGESTFSVTVGEVTSVSLTCTLQNMMVTIEVSDAFSNELVDYDVTITNGSGTLVWKKAEVEAGKAGFFTVAPLKIHVNGYRTATSQASVYDGQITNVAPKDHHVIKLDAVNTGAVGGIDIKVDYSTNDIFSNFEVPGVEWNPVPSDPENPDPDDSGNTPPAEPEKPVIDGLSLSWPANPTFATYPLKGMGQYYNKGDADGNGGTYEYGEVDLSIYAKYHISGFLVKITSPTALFLTTVKDIAGSYYEGESTVVLDLLNPETAAAMTFLPSGDALLGKDSIEFPLGDLLPLITAFAPADGSVHNFNMVVTDDRSSFVAGEENQTLDLTLNFVYTAPTDAN